jgi:hypothetical protein
VWDHERPVEGADFPQDLYELTEMGLLAPALRREYGSLTALRQEHAARRVENVPDEAYTRLIDEKSKGAAELYDLKVVAQAFRERVLEALDDPNNVGRGKIGRRVRDLVKDWVLGQDPLLFAALRGWMKEQRDAGRLTERDYRIVDRMVAEAYRYNVGIALNKNLDVSLSHRRDLYPVTLSMGSGIEEARDRRPAPRPVTRQIEIRPTVYLAQPVLARVPAAALAAVRRHSQYRPKVAGALEVFRATRSIDLDAFAGDLETYLAEVEMAFNDFLSHRQQAEIFDLQKRGRIRAYVKGVVDGGMNFVGLIPGIGSVISTVYGMINTAAGTVAEVRAAARQEERMRGYILGRSDSLERLYEVRKQS